MEDTETLEEVETIFLDPKRIKYSQASISPEFRRILLKKSGEPSVVGRGSYAEALNATVPSDLSLTGAVQQLKDGKVKVTDFPSIRIVLHRDCWYTLDNRRLWVFREYGAPIIPAIVVKADKEFFQKLSREGDGESVTFITPDDAKEYKKNRTLMSEVLKWSVKDIMNENLLKNKVQPIPVCFVSLRKYLEVFKNPLMEEIRAQLQQSLEGIKSSSYISLKSVEEKSSKNDLDNDQLKKFLLLKDPNAPIVDRDSKKKISWSPKPTDLILLTTVLPRTDYRELERFEACYALGLLKGGRNDDDDVLSVVLFSPSESPEYTALKDKKCQWYAVQIGNMATGMRIWEALERSMPEEMNIWQQPKQPLLECLYSESASEREFGDLDGASLFVDESVPDQNPENIASYCRYRGLNKSQATAVTTVVHGLLQRQRPYIRLIQGPPGTGKTSTLATLLTILSCLKQRVLVCASTNVAVSEVALRFLKFFEASNANNKITQYGQFLELGDLEIESSTLSSITLGDVVLIGNEDRLDVKGPLGQLYIDSRVDRLLHALSSISGWRASATNVLEFLRSASSQFDTYKESNEADESGFVGFLRKKIEELAADFVDNYNILSADLPSKIFTARSRTIFHTFFTEITKLVDLVTQTSLEEAEAYLLFQESLTGIGTELLTDTGAEFLKAIDEFKVSLFALVEHLNKIFKVPVKPTRAWVQENCLKHAWLVFSTVSSSGRHILLRSGPFECVVVDEAAQCVEAETTIVTSMIGVKQVVLVGDHMQLPATVLSQISQDCGYARSLFERLQSLGHPMNLLNIQYRMHPAISMFPNMQFYSGEIEDGANVMKPAYSRAHYQQQLFGPYTFINVHDGNEERDDETKSWKNLVEAAIVVHLVSKIYTACRDAKVENVSIGVISPYQSQVKELEKMLSRYDNMPGVIVEVKSVDGFQGREKDLILFSTVRSNSGGHIGFLKDHRRLNVAITRAKYCMWIIGNERTLTSNDDVWKAMISDAKKRKCVTNPGDHPEMTKLIRHVKEELNQLAELLNPNSVLFNGTMWKVLFAKEMKTTFSQVTSTAIRQQFLNTMLNLANGRRSPYPTTSELASLRYRKLIQVQPVADFYLVWTVDIENGQTPRQIIKVWNAVRHVNLARLVRRLEGGYSTCTDIYLERCAKKQYDTSFGSTKKFVVPARWKWDASFVKFKSLERKDKALPASNMDEIGVECAPILEMSAVDESVLLMKFYPLSSGIARQLLTASDGSQLALPFEVNEQEAAIIQYQRSSFIIGRSGTGKTTVITTKLLQREQDFWIAMNSIPTGDNDLDEGCISSKVTGSLKQVLITLSPKLCAAVKHSISKTRRSMQEAAGGVVDGEISDQYEDMMLDDEAETKLMGAIPDSFANVPSDCYPLVITYRKFLTMLDGSVSEPFFPSTKQEPEEDFEPRMDPDTTDGSETVDLNPEHTSSHEVINTDSEREDEYFSDVDDENSSEDDEDDALEENRDRPRGVSASVRNFRVMEVDFERFESMYWSHFNSKFTKNLDPSLVYTEIMSHIKGSVEALHSSFGVLSRVDYISMATRRTSLYTEQQREDIYSLFLQYEKKKKANREYDAADLVTHLYWQLQDDNFLGEKMHFVYVDEVQDFTQAQIALFKFISDNLEDGFLFAGDTAQTIARGVGFRFEDIRRLFYEEFIGKKDQGASSVQSLSKCSSSSVMKVPDLFQLSMNFRTHMGVVGIADSVVQLLHHFFPQSIDKLDPESSLLQGELPVFLKTQENRGLVTSLFDMGGTTGGGGCEFGAEQVILVRDSEAKNYLVKQLGQRGLVLTVHECKGLEFQDVLLYNFFTDSPLQNKWRVIYGFMEAQSLLSCEKYAFPGFDVKRHNLLCSELKQLYVVLTRARQRLWIYDECVEHHQPMLDYWKTSSLVQVKQLDASLAEELQGKSSPEDWRKRGIKMFNERHYDAAMLCFDRAGDTAKAQHAKAAGFEQAAEKLQCTNPKEATRLLREAAELFKSLQKGDAAVKCYIKLEDFKKAGTVYLDVCKPPKLEEAGDCFSEAKCWQEASHAYFGVNMTKCLSTCWRGKLLDLGVSFIQKWDDQRKIQSSADVVHPSVTIAQSREGPLQRLIQVDPHKEKLDFERIKTDFLKKAAGHCHQSKNVTEMMKYVRMFPSLVMRRSFLKRRDYDEQLQLIEEDAGNLEKAAELAEARGDLRRAAKLLERSGFISLAVEKLLHVATMEFRWWNAENRALVQQDLENALAMANQDNSGVGEALMYEIRILMHEILTDDPNLCKLDIFKEIWKQVRKLKVVRLELLSSQVLLPEILGKMRRSLEEIEKSPVYTNIGEFCSVVREQLPDLIEVWNHWSKLMFVYVRAIERLQKGRGRDEDDLILEYVYLHLGVRKHSQHDSLLVENRNLGWLESLGGDISENHAVKRGSLSIKEFAALASEYFSIQIYDLGFSEVFCLLERVHRRLGFPALESKDDLKLTTNDFIRIQMFSFNILSTVLDVRSWEEELKSKMNTAIRDCSRHLYELFFLTLPAGSLKELQIARESPDASPVFERLALDLSSRKPLTFDAVGMLVTLHLFLGREWANGKAFNLFINMNNFGTGVFKDFLWKATHWQHSATLKSTHDALTTEELLKCSFWSRNLFTYLYALLIVFRKVNPGVPGYISPLVYLALLERGVVAACALITHLKSMIISENMALYYMSGKHHEPYYSMVLNCTCDAGCTGDLRGVLHDAVKIIVELLFEVLELERWLHMSKMDTRTYVPPVILRLLKLLITICINVPYGFIHTYVIKSLTTLFEGQSPVLAELPFEFFKELEQIFVNTKTQPVTIFRLVSGFSSAMKSIDDRLVILRKIGRQFAAHMSWHDGALKRLKLVTVRVNQLYPSEFSLATLGPNPAPIIDKPNLQKSATNAGTRNSNFGALISQSQDQIRLASIGDAVEEDSQDIIEESSYSTITDTTEDRWRPDLTDITTTKPVIEIIPYSNTSAVVRLEDGTNLSRKFVEQLQRLLEAARERIAVPLTPLESYQRQARSAFLRRGISDNRYLDLFISEACLLQVDVFERLVTLNKALDYIKGGQTKLDNEEELLEKFSEHKEGLEEALEHVNPKAVKHEEEDLDWLEESIQSLRVLLENGQSQLQGHLRKLFRAAGEVVDTQNALHPGPKSKREGSQTSSAQQLPQKGKKAQQKKKKNKKR